MREIQTSRSLLSAWCSLLRLPNLLTVPGDPLAGAILAASTLRTTPNGNATLSCVLASLCLYAAGLLANDFFDRHQDATERPARPLPSGTLSPRLVLGVSILLTAGALVFAARINWPAAVIALLLALTSWLYNLGGKRLPVTGPLLMGACRSLSLLLGAAAISPSSLPTPTVLIPAAILGLFITSITSIARRETETIRLPLWQVSLPPTLLLLGLSTLLLIPPSSSLITHHSSPFFLLLSTMPVIWTVLLAAQLYGTPPPSLVQRNIGGMIRGLILLQAAFCAAAGGIGETAALCILAAFPVSGWLGKCFQGS